MYFTNKEDLYFYIIEEYRKKLTKILIEKLDENKGDFVMSWEQLYEEIIDYCTENNPSFFRNMFLNMRYTTEKRMMQLPSLEEREKVKKEVLEKVDCSLFYCKDSDELLDAIGLVMMITTGSLAYIFMNPQDVEKEKKIYHQRLHMLKYGIYKRKETDN